MTTIAAHTPTVFATEDEAMDYALSSGRMRPVIAEMGKGKFAVCSLKHARKQGWPVVCNVYGRPPAAEPTAKRAEALDAVEDLLG